MGAFGILLLFIAITTFAKRLCQSYDLSCGPCITVKCLIHSCFYYTWPCVFTYSHRWQAGSLSVSFSDLMTHVYRVSRFFFFRFCALNLKEITAQKTHNKRCNAHCLCFSRIYIYINIYIYIYIYIYIHNRLKQGLPERLSNFALNLKKNENFLIGILFLLQ